MKKLIDYNEIKEESLSSKNNISYDAILNKIIPLLPNNNITIEAKFFLKMLNFLKTIVINIFDEKQMKKQLIDGIEISSEKEYDQRQFQLLLDLAVKLGILSMDNKKYFLLSKYYNIEEYKLPYRELFDIKNVNINLKKTKNPILNDFLFIYLLILHDAGNNNYYELQKRLRLNGKWKEAIKNDVLEYQILTCRYLLELFNITLIEKISSTLDESFYTVLGKKAFNLFTSKKFSWIIKNLNQQQNLNTLLDIGCGYGGFIDLALKTGFFNKIIGVEQQEKVYKNTKETLKNQNCVDILNDNIFNIEFEQNFDVVLLNYILFYFSKEEKIKLFSTIKTLLNRNGLILVCQYYPYFEKNQKALCTLKEEKSLINNISMYFSSILVMAEALLNEILDDFKQSENWIQFEDILRTCGLKVKYIEPADKFYYSYFILIEIDA